MIDFITGTITELTPTYLILENSGIGYCIHISISTYSQLETNTNTTIFIHEIIKEDAHLLYGFFEKEERVMFQHLISVTGVGANIAIMMLSSLSPGEIQQAITNEDSNTLKKIKGIGTKSAQRIIIDLKDKVQKTKETYKQNQTKQNQLKEEALSALVMLGFSKNAAEQTVDKLITENASISPEEIVKKALQVL